MVDDSLLRMPLAPPVTIMEPPTVEAPAQALKHEVYYKDHGSRGLISIFYQTINYTLTFHEISHEVYCTVHNNFLKKNRERIKLFSAKVGTRGGGGYPLEGKFGKIIYFF